MIERRCKHDPILLTLHTQNIPVLYVAQTDDGGARAMLMTDWLPNITDMLAPSLSLHGYLPILQSRTN